MTPPLIRFVKRLIIITVLLVLISLTLMYSFSSEYISPALPFIPVFFLATTSMMHTMLTKAMEKKVNQFINTFLLLSMASLFFYIVVMVAYAFAFRSDAVQFIISFFINFLIYTAMQITTIAGFKKPPEAV